MNANQAMMWTMRSVHECVEGLLCVDKTYIEKIDKIDKQIHDLQEEKKKLHDEHAQKYYPYIKRKRDEAAKILREELEKEFTARKRG